MSVLKRPERGETNPGMVYPEWSTQTNPGMVYPKDTSMPFYRELCALQVQYDQMTSALDWKDPARVRGTACARRASHRLPQGGVTNHDPPDDIGSQRAPLPRRGPAAAWACR